MEWLDTGNNAWQLTAATLVGLMSIPFMGCKEREKLGGTHRLAALSRFFFCTYAVGLTR